MLDRDAAKKIINDLCRSTSFYATVFLADNTQETTRFANSEINQNVSISETSVNLTLYDGKKEATCTGNVITDEGLRSLVKNAEEILSVVPEGEFGRFPMADDSAAENGIGGSFLKSYGALRRAEIIKNGVDKVGAGFKAAGALTLESNVYAVGSGEGAFKYAKFDCAKFNTVVTHDTGAAGSGDAISYMPDDGVFYSAFDKAIETSRRAVGPKPAELGQYTVVLTPAAFGDLISYVAYLMNAKTAEDGISFAIGKMNERVFGENVTIRDDAKHPGTQPWLFDFEGNWRRPMMLIENGIIKNMLHDNKTAARQNLKSSGHAVSNKGDGGYPFNMIVEGGGQTIDEIIAGTPKGIFINEFHYTNFVNPRTLQLTGLTRNGAFMIENGKLTHPISTMRFTQNMIDGLNSVTALSSERSLINVFDTAYLVPAARIENFAFTSKQ